MWEYTDLNIEFCKHLPLSTQIYLLYSEAEFSEGKILHKRFLCNSCDYDVLINSDEALCC